VKVPEGPVTRDQVVTLLTRLVKIPSPYFEEREVMEFAHGWLEQRSVPVRFHNFHENKIYDYKGVNVVGELHGDREGPSIVLNGHLDTVKLCEGWTRDPFGAVIEGGKMYGLGSCDMKSGVAAIMLALQAFVAGGGSFGGRIAYSLVCDEEGPFGLGTDALILDGLMTGKEDVAVITEPSSAFADVPYPSICLGARGGWNYRVLVEGLSAHGAQPENGINAVSEGARVLLELEKTKLEPHEKLGTGSICCVDFQGGGAALSVPDKAFFSIFRHVVVGETKETLVREVEEAVSRAGISGKASIVFREAPHPDCDGFPAYVVPEDNRYASLMQKSMLKVLGEKATFNYFDSVGDFCYTGGRLGLPTLVVGAKGANYHGADEYVEIDTVVGTANVLLSFLESACGRS